MIVQFNNFHTEESFSKIFAFIHDQWRAFGVSHSQEKKKEMKSKKHTQISKAQWIFPQFFELLMFQSETKIVEKIHSAKHQISHTHHGFIIEAFVKYMNCKCKS